MPKVVLAAALIILLLGILKFLNAQKIETEHTKQTMLVILHKSIFHSVAKTTMIIYDAKLTGIAILLESNNLCGTIVCMQLLDTK